MKNKSCRHSHTWLIMSATYEWCYECGALRRMATIEPNSCYPITRWTRPTGRDGENPYPMIELRKK